MGGEREGLLLFKRGLHVWRKDKLAVGVNLFKVVVAQRGYIRPEGFVEELNLFRRERLGIDAQVVDVPHEVVGASTVRTNRDFAIRTYHEEIVFLLHQLSVQIDPLHPSVEGDCP